jgi:hypothetical protein
MKSTWLMGFGTLVAVAGTASASSYTATAPTDDAMIFGTSAGADTGNASGKGPGMFAGADGMGNIKRSLVKFDITSVPTTSTVSGVTVTLVIGQIAGSGGMGSGCGTSCTPASRTFDFYEVDYTNTWGEGDTGLTACNSNTTECASMSGTGQGWPYASCGGYGAGASCGNDVTWKWFDYTSSGEWGNGPSNQDYGTGSFGSPDYGNHTAAGSWTFDDFLNNNTMTFTSDNVSNNTAWTAVVQDWVTTPAHNNGMLIRAPALESVDTSFIGWWTKDGAYENSMSGYNPTITVTY